MSDRTRQTEFVRALLAQEDRVGEPRYATYRRQLDQMLDAEINRRPHRGRRQRARAVLAAALLLLATGMTFTVVQRTSENTRPARTGPLILVDREHSASFEEHPFVALARAEKPIRWRGREVLPLQVERVLKNETGEQPPLFCAAVRDPQPGAAYLVALSERGGWRLEEARPVGERFVSRCSAFLDAARSNDCVGCYERLLAPEAGGVDECARCIFTCSPEPRSADALLARLRALRDQLRKGGRSTAPVPSPIVPQVQRLAEGLHRLGEPSAVLLVVETARLLPHGQRGDLYLLAAAMTARASATVRADVCRLLEDAERTDNDMTDRTGARDALGLIRLHAR